MIELNKVNLKYPVSGHYSHSLQSTIYSKVGGVFGSVRAKEKGMQYVHALRDIDLIIPQSCRLGIIGHNGAGKTTLLRLLSGVYPPTSGSVSVSGKISALTDFTLGMDPNATGLKNIEFRLIFMGCTFKKAKESIKEIVEFSELGDFINLPVRTYSTGMFLRLAFAISTHFTPDILILDEVIGAGDESFREKAANRLKLLIEKSRIVILSSHDLNSIRQFCDRAIVMDKGQILLNSNPDDAIKFYLNKNSGDI